MIIKKCSRCGEEKTTDNFQKRSASTDGLTASCKKCLSEYDKKRANLPHRVKAREQYLKTERGKERSALAKKAYRERNIKKYTATNMINNYIRDGKIIKPSICSICKAENILIHAHHHDYSKPLDVIWCCEQCHAKIHGKLK